MKTLKNFNFKDKKVLIRFDFNVPLDQNGDILSDNKIKETIPTINYVLNQNAKQLILMSHLGNPEGKIIEKLKMNNIARYLEKLLNKRVIKLDDCINLKIPPDKIILLENLRFHKEEELNDIEFAKKLASYADVYINDAFATMHREHASTTSITRFIPSCIGLLVEKELKYLSLENPEKPIVAIIGGSKISTKLSLIKELLKKVDYLLIGGAMVFTFLKAKGHCIGKSLYEEHLIEEAKELLKNEKLILPKDIVVSKSIENEEVKIVSSDNILGDWIGLDIGPNSINLFKDYLNKAKTVIWNGPLGYFEVPKFANATIEIAKYLADSNKTSIAGGGDTESALRQYESKFTYISTGGGATLEFLSGKELPAIKSIKENNNLFK
jgi:3-phosphoglycerate kinase